MDGYILGTFLCEILYVSSNIITLELINIKYGETVRETLTYAMDLTLGLSSFRA